MKYRNRVADLHDAKVIIIGVTGNIFDAKNGMTEARGSGGLTGGRDGKHDILSTI